MGRGRGRGSLVSVVSPPLSSQADAEAAIDLVNFAYFKKVSPVPSHHSYRTCIRGYLMHMYIMCMYLYV